MVNIRPEDMSRAAYYAPVSSRRSDEARREEAARADAQRGFGFDATLRLVSFFMSALGAAVAMWASPRSVAPASGEAAADPRLVDADLAKLRDHNIIRHTARNLLTEARKQGSTVAPVPVDAASTSKATSKRSVSDD